MALAIPALIPVALVLGGLALRQSSMPNDRVVSKASLALALVSGLGWGGAVLLARDRVRRSEASASCMAGLQTLLLAQDRFRAARGRFADESELGLTLPPSGATFFQTPRGAEEARLKTLEVGRAGTCPDCRVTLACSSGGRWWTISSADRTRGGKSVPAATPVEATDK